MATSGYKRVEAGHNISLEYRWNVTNQLAEQNATVVSYKVSVICASSRSSYASPNLVLSNKTLAIVNNAMGQNKYTVSATVKPGETKVLYSGSITVPHEANGTKSMPYSFYLSFDLKDNGLYIGTVSGSGTANLPDIPRAPIITYSEDFMDTSTPRLGYANPAGVSIESMRAYITFDDTYTPATIITKNITDFDSGEVTFSLTDAAKEKLYTFGDMPTLKECEVDFVVESTQTNGTVLKTKVTRMFRIDENGALPANGNLHVLDKSTYTALTSSNTILINGHNLTHVYVTPSGRKGATIASVTAECLGYDLKMDPTGESIGYFENITFRNHDELPKIYVTTTDSRGFSRRNAVVPTGIIPYITPTLQASAYVITPEASSELTIKLHIEGDIYNREDIWATGANTIHVDYQYSVNGGEYTEWINVDSYISYQGYTEPTRHYHTVGDEITIGSTFHADDEVAVRIRAYDIDISEALIVSDAVNIRPTYDWSKTDFNFNVPVNMPQLSITNVPMTDFVMEQGTKTVTTSAGTFVWNYQKWNSGKLECWTNVEGSATITKSDSGVYTSNAIYVKYPFTFSVPPTLQVTGGSNGHVTFARRFGALNDNSRANAIFQTFAFKEFATAEPYVVCLYAIGKI